MVPVKAEVTLKVLDDLWGAGADLTDFDYNVLRGLLGFNVARSPEKVKKTFVIDRPEAADLSFDGSPSSRVALGMAAITRAELLASGYLDFDIERALGIGQSRFLNTGIRSSLSPREWLEIFSGGEGANGVVDERAHLFQFLGFSARPNDLAEVKKAAETPERLYVRVPQAQETRRSDDAILILCLSQRPAMNLAQSRLELRWIPQDRWTHTGIFIPLRNHKR